MHFVALGEADGLCVSLADRLEGYVLGQDSDFMILVGGAGVSHGLKGYCPFDMMWWIEAEAQTEDHSSKDRSGWSTAGSPRRGLHQGRQSTLLPPSNMANPRLVLTSFTAQFLRQRLRLPASVLPLFASLCGNDYTPPSATEVFFEPGFTPVQKVEKVARILRETIFSPRSGPPKAGSAGDHAVELVKKAIKTLCLRPFVNDQALQDLADAVIEASFQYSLPISRNCCSAYPFCGELDACGCQSEMQGEPTDSSIAKQAYARAQKRGLLNGITRIWSHPNRVYLWSVLEDPTGPSHNAQSGLREIRQVAMEIADHGLGGLRWPQSAAVMDDGNSENEGQEPISLIYDVGTNSDSGTVGDTDPTNIVDEHSAVYTGSNHQSVTEYMRQGSSGRIIGHLVELSPPNWQETPVCIQSLEARLRAYLVALKSDTPAIIALPPHLHPLVGAIRFCIVSARSDQWRRTEVEAVLEAGLGSYAAWRKEASSPNARRDTEDGFYPILTTRNCGLVAQLSATMTDGHLLAQALLLGPDAPDQWSEKPDLTHLTPFVFFSGAILHTLLSGEKPQSLSVWRWTETELETFEMCFAAITEKLEDVIVGWARSPGKVSGAVVVSPEKVEVEEIKKANKKKRNPNARLVGKGPGSGSGRFEALKGLTAS